MTNPDRDPESGKLSERYSDEDFLEAVTELEPASTREIAEAVECSRRNADVRLKRLEESGKVRSKMVGNSLSWMLAG